MIHCSHNRKKMVDNQSNFCIDFIHLILYFPISTFISKSETFVSNSLLEHSEKTIDFDLINDDLKI